MKYIDLHNRLKEVINYESPEIIVDEKTVVQNFDFESKYSSLIMREDQENYKAFIEQYEPYVIQPMLYKNDAEIIENTKFRYFILRPAGKEKIKGIIFMFHGFNEKHWNKYLTWAKHLVDETGKAVVFFPIAFHMNRAPLSWSDGHQMYAISQKRRMIYPDVINSTLSNAAISIRLHIKPQRFIWSGLQSYYDVLDLVKEIKADLHPSIDKDAGIDFFSYSIGSLFAQIVMMTNENGYFSNAKFCLFCGGAVFNRLSPVSKFILDSEANVRLYSYIVEHLESHMKKDKTLAEYLSESHPEGYNFRSMLNYAVLTDYREKKFREMSNRMLAIALAKDTVVAPYEVINTLQGSKRDIPVHVEIFDFPYTYRHEDPFPAIESIADEVDVQFNRVFDKFCEFLK